jgi:hypothetical protein
MAAREPVDLPVIDRNHPQCIVCGGQPAWPRDGGMPYCEACWRSTLGDAYDGP